MRIASIETFLLEAPIQPGFGWSQGWADKRHVGLVKLVTDDGIVGWGEGLHGPSVRIVHEEFAPVLLGADPMQRNLLWQAMFRLFYNGNVAGGIGGSAISAIDTALWDIAGKASGLPVWALLGGKVRDRIAVYATGLYYTEENLASDGRDIPQRLLDEARMYVDLGFTGMKTKVGGLPLAQDVRRVAAIREAIGPDIFLMADANQAYNATTAIRIGRELAELDVYWFEEPVNAKDVEGYLQVKAALPMAIAGGENLRTRYEFKDFIGRRCIDIVQPDVVMVGGITEMHRVAAMANAFGILCNPHVWGSPVMIAASLHVASAVPECPPARTPRPYQQEPVMEFDRTPSPIREGIAEPFDQAGGFLDVPTGPGLGVEIDEAAVRQLSVDTQETGK
ncbi:MAG: mandelate racemase/muconate lactonizing enzyme family protein [Caldilineaceae bacterium SB0665_bin_25]|nr:mandelate racemase/muconate lactonizing enzyme family protein [Caldilineaceae bacterium SB0665_bin_25]